MERVENGCLELLKAQSLLISEITNQDIHSLQNNLFQS